MPAGMPMTATLDEPISETVLRDLKAIGRKIKLVMGLKSDNYNELRNWDLWGPLILCLFLAIILGLSKKAHDEKGQTFAGVFTGVSVGSTVVTLNAQFLGGHLSFFQIVCVLGYCLFPLCAAATLCLILPERMIWKMIPCLAAFVWSTYASRGFVHGAVREERRALVVYPIGLFYFFVAWMLVAGI
uniref:Protein YIPF n=1 Tax=Eutreptiella gymnastica TaxID=73025 RepID=A0A7S4LML3_9EUGL